VLDLKPERGPEPGYDHQTADEVEVLLDSVHGFALGELAPDYRFSAKYFMQSKALTSKASTSKDLTQRRTGPKTQRTLRQTGEKLKQGKPTTQGSLRARLLHIGLFLLVRFRVK
jgi:hypothetical protein